jgi:hypothetical protein
LASILQWILDDSDPALRYQARRDLVGEDEALLSPLRERIGREGWGGELLGMRQANGHWGNGAYNPKWTCTHYALFELLQLGITNDEPACRESAALLLDKPQGKDGGINYAKTVEYSDVCVNGMLLSIASHFRLADARVDGIVRYLLHVQMADGGWNCEYCHGAHHGSLHTTISVLEGLEAFMGRAGSKSRNELDRAVGRGIEFILRHRLFKSETTGERIADEFLKFTFPIRWKYDILRCLDSFRAFGIPHDERMDEALAIVAGSREADGRVKARSQAGKTYFVREKNGKPGRWNTLRVARVLARYGEPALTAVPSRPSV